MKELDAALDAGKKKQEALSEELAPLRREAHRVSDSLAEAKLAQATLSERTTYAERVRDARVRDLETLAAASEEAPRGPAARRPVSAARIEPVLALIDELTASAPEVDASAGGAGHGRRGLLHRPAILRHRGPRPGP